MNAMFPPPAVVRDLGLTDLQRNQRAHAAALAIVEAGARETAQTIIALRRRDVEEGAKIMLAQRWRITKVLYPGRNPAMWPIPGKPATDCLADCARMIAAQEANRAAGHWTFDGARLVALQQAEAALLAIIMGGEPDAPRAA